MMLASYRGSMLQRPLASLLPTSAKINAGKGDRFTVMLGQQRGSRGLLGHGVQEGAGGYYRGREIISEE